MGECVTNLDELLAQARAVVRQFPALAGATVAPMAGGLINHTFAVTCASGPFILQRVNPIFSPTHHHNIAAVTQHLHARGMLTPQLVPTAANQLWATAADGSIWRVLTRISGRSFDSVQTLEQAHSAGALVARFHTLVADLQHTFIGLRSGVHDTAAHLRNLELALQRHPEHPLFADVCRLGQEVLAGLAELGTVSGALPQRIAHGDLKFSNLLFSLEDTNKAQCLVDLDTLAPMPLHHELGDAWRSWCNTGDENRSEAEFSLARFEASVTGYLGNIGFELAAGEPEALVIGPEWISLELAARFAADALNESYFGWDRSQFSRAGEHNLLRARGQLSLATSARSCRRQRMQLLCR